MPHNLHPHTHGLRKGEWLLIIFAGGVIFLMIAAFCVSLMFDFRHTKDFAARELEGRGFAQMSVLKKYTIAHGMGMPSLPTENWFDFMATKDGQKVQGRLVCYRQFDDFEKSRCELQYS